MCKARLFEPIFICFIVFVIVKIFLKFKSILYIQFYIHNLVRLADEL